MAFPSSGGRYGDPHDTHYRYSSPYPDSTSYLSTQDYTVLTANDDLQRQKLEKEDSKIKRRIRWLRLISRILAVILSIAVVVPLTMTLIKYLTTHSNTVAADGGNETRIWPDNPNTTYTYVYFSVSVASLLLNAVILLSYFYGTRAANNWATVGTVWTSVVVVAHITIWIAAVAIYRYGKRKVDDKWEDLWGWTCSKTADELQPFAKEISFKKYCNIQDAGYYAGLLQVGAGLLTGVVLILMMRRERSKKRLQSYQLDDAKEPLRR